MTPMQTLLSKAQTKERATITFRKPGYGFTTLRAYVTDTRVGTDNKLRFTLEQWPGEGYAETIHEDLIHIAY